jgi:enamine deaminase RidA (YjgF/YER057c/UK114 family)
MKKTVAFSQALRPLSVPGTECMQVSQCIRAEHLAWISGQTAVDLDGRFTGGDSVVAQIRQSCNNVKELVQMAGATLADVVKVVVYVTDRTSRGVVTEALCHYFPDVLPCVTLYVVPGLARREFLITMDALAVLGGGEDQRTLVSNRSVEGSPGRRAAQSYRVGNLVVLEGQTGGAPGAGRRAGHGPADEAKQAMENLPRLMQMAGGNIGDVVRLGKAVTRYADRATTYPVLRQYWPGAPPPGTGLIVDGLTHEESRIAVDAWGFVDTDGGKKKVVRTHDVSAAVMLGATGVATQCVRAGDFVFMQGQVAWTLDGQLVGTLDPRGQARQAMDNIATLMELAGGALSDVTRIVVYVTDPAVFGAAYLVLDEYWNGVWPCLTSVVVKGLARPELLLEIDAYGLIDRVLPARVRRPRPVGSGRHVGPSGGRG